MMSTRLPLPDRDDRPPWGALRLLATVGLWTLVVASAPARAMVEGPPGANVGDTPADFEGLAIAVDVGAHTGNATFEYPFALPPGRNGFQPDLKLVYSHLARDTDVGFGWTLPLGRIERVTRRGVPRYNDTSDALEVTLPDRRFELVRAGSGWAARVDDVHVSVTASPSPALRMTMPSGLVYTFGDTTASRIVRPNTAASTSTIFAWYLTRIEDPNGNWIDIFYSQDQGYAYPDRLSYGKNPGAGIAHQYEVYLRWDARTAPQRRISCAAGFCRTTARTLGAVIVEAPGGGRIRGFTLTWEPSAVNHVPLLREIQVEDAAGTVLATASLQPASTRFAYHEPTLKTWTGSLPGNLDWAAHDYAPPVTYDEFNDEKLPWRDWKPEDPCTNRDFVDVNGDGLPDWVRSSANYDQDGMWTVRLNQGRGSSQLFGPRTDWPAPRRCLARRVEAYWLYTGYPKWSELNDEIGSVACDGNTDPAQKLRCSQATKEGLVDLDGDGRPEYVDSDQPDGVTFWKVWFQNPSGPGFQANWVAWPVPVPPATSAMAGRRYRLDFTEHSVEGFHFFNPNPSRFIMIGEEISGAIYVGPTSQNWIRMRQRPVHALVDMNGDGRPDLVDVGLGASVPGEPGVHNYGGQAKGQVRVYWNRGTGFDADYEVLLGGPPNEPIQSTGTSPNNTSRSSSSGNSGKREQNVTAELFDLNGDGLRDVVKALGNARAQAACGAPWKWQVWFGTGLSYPKTQVDPQPGLPSFDGPHCWDSPQNEELREWSKKRGLVDVIDVNADGLPDYVNATNFKGSTTPVTICDGGDCYEDFPYNPLWRVWINTGTGLEDRGVVFFPKNIRTNALEPDGQGGDTTTVGLVTETFDLDGNGYPDNVQTGTEGHLKINYRHPENLAPNLLVKVTNPLGGTTDIDYAVSTEFNTPEVDPGVDAARYHHHLPFPLWVVQSITQSDPAAGENGKVRARWEYGGGYFNPAERSFVGFRAVDQIKIVPNPAQSGALKDGPHEYAEFHQTLGREGRKQLEYVFVDEGYNGLLAHRAFTWTLATRDESSGWRRYFPTLSEHLEVDASSNPGLHWDGKYCPDCPTVPPAGGFRARRERFLHDTCGNVTRTTAFDATEGHRTKNPGVDVQLRRVDSTFSTSSTCNAAQRTCTGICDRVLTRKVMDLNEQVAGLSEEFKYERGNEREAKRIGEGNPTITRTFDTAGNLQTIVDARGTVTTIEYDAGRQMYPAKWVVDAGGKNHTTEREYHSKFGAVTKHTDPAGAVTLYDYDPFGRLVAVAEPGQSLAHPTRRYRYVIERSLFLDLFTRSRVEAEFREPAWNLGADPYRKEVTFYDALGRRLQRQVHREVGGSVVAVALDAVDYDASGKVVREPSPTPLPMELVSTFIPLSGLPATTITRDEFLREIGRTAPDGSARTTNRRTAWVTKECDAVNTSNAARGQCIVEEVDALDRPHRNALYLRSDPNPTRSEVRDYLPSGALGKSTVSGASTTSVASDYTYDALVRLKTKDDPSSGLWTYGYDLNDNRTLEDDPTAGRQLTLTYDRLNRVESRTERRNGTAERSTTVAYDGPVAFGTGRLHKVTRQQTVGTQFSHEQTRTGYDGRGNVTGSTQRIQAGTTTRSFATARSYDAIGRLVTMTLPAPDGNEALVYGYAPTGEVVAVGSNRNPPYVTDVQYDERGRMTQIAYGNGVTDTFAYHTADGRDGAGGAVRSGHGDRIAHVTSRHEGRNETLSQLDYTAYTLNGQVTRVMGGLGGVVFQDALYDDAARLVQWSAPGFGTLAYAYDGLGRLTNKEGKPYTYVATKPFHIQTYDGGNVTYDESGNLAQLPGNQGNKTFAYDAEENLLKATEGSAVTEYFADDGGTRRVKVGPTGSKTFFFDDFDAEITGGTIRRHIRLNGQLVATSSVSGSGMLQTAHLVPDQRDRLRGIAGVAALVLLGICLGIPGRARHGPRRVARRWPVLLAALLVLTQASTVARAQCVPPPPFTETRLYYHVDHVGSVQLLTNVDGRKHESTRHYPYGVVADRRNGSGTLISDTQGEFAFTGHRKEESHGLAYFGARYYAPELAVFASRDPAGQFPNPYSYADGDPLNGRDPTGGEFESTSITDDLGPAPIYDANGDLAWLGTTYGSIYADPVVEEPALTSEPLQAFDDDPEHGQATAPTIDPLDIIPFFAATRVPRLAASAGARTAAQGLPALRQGYVDAVSALAERATAMRQAGASSEQIARALHATRRALGEQFKASTPAAKLAEIHQRNLQKYGDRLGPSIDWLRAQGKSWEQIIESASRAGGKDLGF